MVLQNHLTILGHGIKCFGFDTQESSLFMTRTVGGSIEGSQLGYNNEMWFLYGTWCIIKQLEPYGQWVSDLFRTPV